MSVVKHRKPDPSPPISPSSDASKEELDAYREALKRYNKIMYYRNYYSKMKSRIKELSRLENNGHSQPSVIAGIEALTPATSATSNNAATIVPDASIPINSYNLLVKQIEIQAKTIDDLMTMIKKLGETIDALRK